MLHAEDEQLEDVLDVIISVLSAQPIYPSNFHEAGGLTLEMQCLGRDMLHGASRQDHGQIWGAGCIEPSLLEPKVVPNVNMVVKVQDSCSGM